MSKGKGPTFVVRDLFAMPVEVAHWTAAQRLNGELREAIMKRFNTSLGVVISNRKGWHSNFDLHEWPEPCIAEFMGMVRDAAANMVRHIVPDADKKYLENWQVKPAWANVNPAGAHNDSHHHLDGGAHLSGFYYVDVGRCDGPTDRGCTIFEDRSGVARPALPDRHPLSREFALVPTPGTMAMFPASQMHYVEPYKGEGVRITIAFNLTHPEFEILYYPGMQSPGWWWKNFRGVMVATEKVPEKLRALRYFASYAREVFRSGRDASLRDRLKNLYERASVDAAAKTAERRLVTDRPVQKQRLV